MRASGFAARFSAEAFTLLSQAIDSHRVDPNRLRVATTLIGLSSDQIVPLAQVRELAAGLGRFGRLIELTSPYGHDGFLKEVDALSAILRRELSLAAEPEVEVALEVLA